MTERTTDLNKVLTLAEAFIASHKGKWSNEDWAKLVAEARTVGVDLEDDHTKQKLGKILEGAEQLEKPAARTDTKNEPS